VTQPGTESRRMDSGASVADLLEDLSSGAPMPGTPGASVFATGFSPLDDTLHGGVRSHDLVLVAGAPGIGKTVATLQWARHMAMSGTTVIYVCYEHTEAVLFERLLSMELAELAHRDNSPALDKLRPALRHVTSGDATYAELVDSEPLVHAANTRLLTFANRLHFVRGYASTGLDALEKLVVQHGNGHNVLIVDYLQKVPETAQDERDKTLRVAEGLKDLALTHDVAVIATVAADYEGLASNRLRLHHLRGSSALSYEADVVLMLNEKHRAVAKIHLSYDPPRAEGYKHWVVFSLEKNRGGPAQLDMEFEKRFENYCFAPRGRYVVERLIDERIYTE
jgi:replicative DNA helicase